MKVGLALPHYDFSFPDGRPVALADVADYARRAESLGFDSVWVSDHLFLDLERYGGPPRRHRTPEAFAMLAALAVATERVRIGSLVLCASFRHPRVLVEQARSVDELSGRRLDLGLGAGWYEAEFASAGIPFGTAAQRIDRLARVVGMLDGLLSPRPPIWVGGKGGPKVLRVVAESADGWNVVWRMTPEEYRARLDVLAEQCDRYKRDPETVARSVGFYCLLGEEARDVAARFARLQAWMPGIAGTDSLQTFARGALVGTPEECAQTLKEFEALGVEHVILSFASLPFSVYDDDQLEIAARELIPLVR